MHTLPLRLTASIDAQHIQMSSLQKAFKIHLMLQAPLSLLPIRESHRQGGFAHPGTAALRRHLGWQAAAAAVVAIDG
jgi:hypothetical protein